MKSNLISTEPNPGLPKWSMILIYSLVVLFLGLLAYGILTTNTGIVTVGTKVPDFSLTTFEGETIQMSSLPQKLRVVNIWASWCTTCDDEAPALEEAWQHFKSEDVFFLGVAASDTGSDALDFINTFDLTYPNGLDKSDRIANIFNSMAVPETYFLDRDGVVLYRQIGSFRNSQQIIQIIDKLLLNLP